MEEKIVQYRSKWFNDSSRCSMVVQYGSRLYKMLKNLSQEAWLDFLQNSRVMGRGSGCHETTTVIQEVFILSISV